MSRTRRAMVSSFFGYLQYAVAIGVSIVLVPIVLVQVDARAYGLWLASTDLLSYIALLDVGIFGILPWLIAEADGRRDEAAIRRMMSNGLALAAGLSLAVMLVALIGWAGAGHLLHLTPADRAVLAGPLLVLVAGTVLMLPINVSNAVLAGMQDVKFTGGAAVVRLLLNAAVTLGLLWRGWGLWAIAIGVTGPAILVGLTGAVRLWVRFPALRRDWPRPSWQALRWLAQAGIGGWVGAFGWKLIAMSSGLLLAIVGHPELVPLYSCTARLSVALMQMGWIVPDSGLVGLAQLHGEGRPERLRQMARAMLRLHLIIGGGSATVLLAINPAFVSWWVSEALYGGHQLNVLLAAGVVVGSVSHALATVASVVGRRIEVGVATLANGVLHVTIAYVLLRMMGFQGIALAALVAVALSMLPVGVHLVATQTGMAPRELVRSIVVWAVRAGWLLAAAFVVGLLVPPGSVWLAIVLWLPIGALYLWMVRPLYDELPLDPRFRDLLVRLRLIPATVTPGLNAVEEPVA
jgi:O-antigen/teichoic acid export membrane protein